MMIMHNYKKGKFEEVHNLEHYLDYIPQDCGTQGLYKVYVWQMGYEHLEALRKTLEGVLRISRERKREKPWLRRGKGKHEPTI